MTAKSIYFALVAATAAAMVQATSSSAADALIAGTDAQSHLTLATAISDMFANWPLQRSMQFPENVLRYARSRPVARDPMEAALIAAEPDLFAQVVPTETPAAVPDNPLAASGVAGKSRLAMWLCLCHREVGGALTSECPEDIETRQRALGPESCGALDDGLQQLDRFRPAESADLRVD